MIIKFQPCPATIPVPESYVSQMGHTCIFIRDHLSRELDLEEGDEVEVLGNESGWAWVVDEKDRKGWIPQSCRKRVGFEDDSG